MSVTVALATAAYGAPGDTLAIYSTRYSEAPGQTYEGECFGRRGSFHGGTFVIRVDWDRNHSWDECFAIAPDNRIYHAWPNSAGWDPMPNDGRADEVNSAFLYQGRYHTITVQKFGSGGGYFCSSLIDNTWRPWARCDPRGPAYNWPTT